MAERAERKESAALESSEMVAGEGSDPRRSGCPRREGVGRSSLLSVPEVHDSPPREIERPRWQRGIDRDVGDLLSLRHLPFTTHLDLYGNRNREQFGVRREPNVRDFSRRA